MSWEVFYNKNLRKAEVVKNDFHWLGLCFGIFYLFFKGLWKQGFLILAGLIVLAIALVEIISPTSPAYDFLSSFVIPIGVGIYIGRQSPDWLKEKLVEKGYTYIGSFPTKDEAKARKYSLEYGQHPKPAETA